MKRSVLTEDTITPLKKMHDANIGRRRQNWSACSDQKLQMYYKICLDYEFNVAKTQAEAEIIKRDKHVWLVPRPLFIDNFTATTAQLLWDQRHTCHRFIQSAIDLPVSMTTTIRPSEYLLGALILAIAMDRPELKMLIVVIKNHMKDAGTYYDLVPGLIDKLLKREGIPSAIAAAVSTVDYTK